jgi:hypothetical protein
MVNPPGLHWHTVVHRASKLPRGLPPQGSIIYWTTYGNDPERRTIPLVSDTPAML